MCIYMIIIYRFNLINLYIYMGVSILNVEMSETYPSEFKNKIRNQG